MAILILISISIIDRSIDRLMIRVFFHFIFIHSSSSFKFENLTFDMNDGIFFKENLVKKIHSYWMKWNEWLFGVTLSPTQQMVAINFPIFSHNIALYDLCMSRSIGILVVFVLGLDGWLTESGWLAGWPDPKPQQTNKCLYKKIMPECACVCVGSGETPTPNWIWMIRSMMMMMIGRKCFQNKQELGWYDFSLSSWLVV